MTGTASWPPRLSEWFAEHLHKSCQKGHLLWQQVSVAPLVNGVAVEVMADLGATLIIKDDDTDDDMPIWLEVLMPLEKLVEDLVSERPVLQFSGLVGLLGPPRSTHAMGVGRAYHDGTGFTSP